MTTQKKILSAFILIITVGVVVWAIRSNNQAVDIGVIQIPSGTSEKPTPPPSAPSTVSFGKVATLKYGSKAVFADGFTVILTHIDDSRCPSDVQCIWAGELSPTLELSGGDLKNAGEVRMGTTTKTSVTVEDYTISLEGATETSVSIMVMKN